MSTTAPMGCTRLMLSKPVIAAVSAFALAGATELALWCDLRVMEDTATFGIFCRRCGVPLIDGGTLLVPAPDRHEPRARPDPHRAPGRCAGSAGDGAGQPGGAARRYRAHRENCG